MEVTDSDTHGAVPGLALANLVGPPPRVGAAALSAQCWSTAVRSACEVWGPVPGTYVFDVTGTGYQPLHLEVVVPEVPVLPGACCPLGWEPQQLEVSLVPIPSASPASRG